MSTQLKTKPKRRWGLAVSLIIGICIICGCVTVFAPRTDRTAPATTAAPQPTQVFTATEEPVSETPEPTNTARPSNTPKSTNTTAATAAPTNTTPPTNTRAPAATQPQVQATQPQPQPTQSLPTQAPQATATEAAPPPTAAPAFTVVNITSPISAGSNANVTIQTAAGASCFLGYTTPSGTVSEAQGLGAATADGNGICSWTWRIGGSTNPGTGSLAITANGVTQYFQIVIQ